MKRTLVLACLAASTALLLAVPRADAAFPVDCTFVGGGDLISRGLYVSNYAGTSIDQVALGHSAAVAGERTITLTARLNTFDGTFLGVASVTRTIGTTMSLSVFDFGHIAVPAGSRITFTQTLIAGAGSVFFDTGVGPCTDVTETEDTTAPLSTIPPQPVGRRHHRRPRIDRRRDEPRLPVRSEQWRRPHLPRLLRHELPRRDDRPRSGCATRRAPRAPRPSRWSRGSTASTGRSSGPRA